MNLNRVLRLAAAAAAATAGLAQAQTFSNSHDSTIYYFGAPDTTSYGEVFNLASSQVLNDWSFYADSGNAGNMSLVVANWDGTKAVGPALYTSSALSYGGGSSALSFSGINTGLAAGSYIAYLTVAGLGNPTTRVVVGGSNSDGGLGGGFRFLNSNGGNPLSSGSSWSSWDVSNMQYNANFSVAGAVPEPETYAMMAIGLGFVGYAARKRRTADKG